MIDTKMAMILILLIIQKNMAQISGLRMEALVLDALIYYELRCVEMCWQYTNFKNKIIPLENILF